MGKKLIIFILIINLYGDFYLDYKKENGKIETVELTRTEFDKFKTQYETYKDKLKWENEKKFYDILSIYERKKEENQTLTNTIIEEKKTNYLSFIIIVIIILLFRKFKRNKHKQNKINEEIEKIEFDNQLFIEENKEIKIENYEDSEKKRVEIYKKIKYIRTLEKDKKIKLYEEIKQIKQDIKDKKEITEIINKLKKIERNLIED